jgi:hypothetical protein
MAMLEPYSVGRQVPSHRTHENLWQHLAVRRYTPNSLSWLEACKWGYPICRVPTVALGLFQER